jgi:hypothetical protein
MTAGLIFLLAGCKQPDRDALVKPIMDKRLHDRLNEVRTREKLSCYEALMKDALKIADSLLRENPLLIKIDSLERPAKPLKPIAPEIQKPVDTVLLKPLIEPDTAIENEN